MHHVFERDFDQEALQERERELRDIRARHTPEELAQAVAEAADEAFRRGWNEGHASGTAETHATLLARQIEVLDRLGPVIGDMIQNGDSHRKALEAQAVDFVLSVFEQIFPEFRGQRAVDRVAEQARRAAALALGSAKLRIFLSPSVQPGLAPILQTAARAQGFTGRVEIEAEAGLADGDLRAEWDNGFMEYSFDAVCAQILDALGRSKAAFTATSLNGNNANV